MDERLTEAMESLQRVNSTLLSTAIELTVWLDMLSKAVRYLSEGDPAAARELMNLIDREEGDPDA